MTYALEDIAVLYVGSFAMSLLGAGVQKNLSRVERSEYASSLQASNPGPHFWKKGASTPGTRACNIEFDDVGYPVQPRKKIAELTWATISTVCPGPAEQISSMAQLQITHTKTRVLILCSAIYSVSSTVL